MTAAAAPTRPAVPPRPATPATATSILRMDSRRCPTVPERHLPAAIVRSASIPNGSNPLAHIQGPAKSVCAPRAHSARTAHWTRDGVRVLDGRRVSPVQLAEAQKSQEHPVSISARYVCPENTNRTGPTPSSTSWAADRALRGNLRPTAKLVYAPFAPLASQRLKGTRAAFRAPPAPCGSLHRRKHTWTPLEPRALGVRPASSPTPRARHNVKRARPEDLQPLPA